MLSIIVPWRDRKELRDAAGSWIAASRAVGGDVTVVNFGGSRQLLRDLLRASASDVAVVDVEPRRYFNKSLAQNLGALHARNELLFFCDCDIVLEVDCVREIVRQLVERRSGVFATLKGVTESQPNSRGGKHVISFGYRLEIRTADGRRLETIDSEEDAETGARNAPGLLFVRRGEFLGIDGYNSRLLGWGWEDQDMVSRLTLGAGLQRLFHGQAEHLSHDDHARVAHYPLANRWESRDRMFRQALSSYDNKEFRGTYSTDIVEVKAERIAGECL